PSARRSTISATASTWPETRCPPSSSPAFSARSRLIPVPTRQSLSVERARVSAEAWTANQSAPRSITVRQTPAQATDAPSARSLVSSLVPMMKVVSPPTRISRSVPISVNISACPGQGFEHVFAASLDAEALEAPRRGERRHAEGFNGWSCVAAEQGRCLEPGEAVDEIGLQQRPGQLRPAFDEDAGETALGERRQGTREVELRAARERRFDQHDAAIGEGLAARRIEPMAMDDPGRQLLCLGNELCRQRQMQAAIDDDAHGIASRHAGQAA